MIVIWNLPMYISPMDKGARCFMKKFFVLMLLILGGLGLLSLHILHEDNPPGKCALLIINERSTTSYARINKDFIELPLIEVLRGLGCTINYVDDNVTNIVVNNTLFTLETESLTLRECGDSTNLLIPPPGNKFFSCKLSDGDIWLDNIALKGVLYLMGIRVDVSYSSDDQIVTVSAQDS